jgi:peptidoglycan/xylan/chitin deacetylase (PgdA/CDA1 family)
MDNYRISDLSELDLPLRLARQVQFNVAPVVAEGTTQAVITSRELADEFAEISGGQPENFPMSTRIFHFSVRKSDDVIVRSADGGLPLVIRRDGEVIVNFDILATQVFHFADSHRPIYTYIPGLTIQSVPERIRRPISNLVRSLRAPRGLDVAGGYKRLPLTGFEFTLFLLNTILTTGLAKHHQTFRWPHGKRAVFIALHDVDTAGFLGRGERDPLFRLEAEHQIRSTWFIPTKILNCCSQATDFLLRSGNDVGWHGHKHDHRDHIKPFADEAVQALQESRLADTANSPVGMRLPNLLKSNYLFERLDHHCPTLCYDTSFFGVGIVPYHLWINGRESRLLEIPTTVPTDIRVYNELNGLPRARKAAAILKIQIARTQKLLEVGGLISIVTHPEKGLSERPEFLDIYNQYLSYIRSCPDIWFATAKELFQYWTQNSFYSARRTA